MVGFTRYKFFLQFVTYSATACSYTVASVAPVQPFLEYAKGVADGATDKGRRWFSYYLAYRTCSGGILWFVYGSILDVTP